MKNSTIYKIFAFAVVAAIFIFSILWTSLGRKGNISTTQNNNPLPIPANNGEVRVRDFTKNPVQQSHGAMEIESQPKYSIVYYQNDNSFVITLLAEPLKEVRQQAEVEFLKNLNI